MTTTTIDHATELAALVGADHVLVGDAINDDYTRDEALTSPAHRPAAVVRPGSTEEVAAVVTWAAANGVPVTARGSGTGLSGACIPQPDGILVSFERMDQILEIDLRNHVAVVQPGVTLAQLDEATKAHGLIYPVQPGENSASLGGNVATNAGGMRAVRYGVTRSQVLGLTCVLGTGEVLTTGGKFVKATSGYDLTQLVIGSEGTLALATEAILRLHPRPTHGATVLAPFTTLDEVAAAIPHIVGSGLQPSILEYIDLVSMAGITSSAGLELGIPQEIKDTALAYLVIVLEGTVASRIEEDTAALGQLLGELGALDLYVLPPSAGAALVDAREKAFWTAKALGANDIIDLVVPRAEIPGYLAAVKVIADDTASLVVGCGHAGDGNVHLSVFQGDPAVRSDVVGRILRAGADLGGAVSGEHGIGTAKKAYLAAIEDPAKLDLMRRIKVAFDPTGILNPGVIFDATSPAEHP
ncbi:FAD-binding oxidoreductase [Aquihabitans sp. G128]|uniref:FAD-binding oxidoreductase n=1 Tax=Aquihabitans sp. G128 TaxID=2849779 RepID=UPI001C21A455|nr:FAD-binding oxidoreductase [Aquihabitans sp. G128]QXC59579.1 FAD-binding oxidoreductase [Aquihabitans sp. G128]